MSSTPHALLSCSVLGLVQTTRRVHALQLDGNGMPALVPTEMALVCPRQQAPKPGQEITISYGDKSNEQLLMAYGTCWAGCAVLRCAVLCCAALRCAALCCAVLCCAVLRCAVVCWAGLVPLCKVALQRQQCNQASEGKQLLFALLHNKSCPQKLMPLQFSQSHLAKCSMPRPGWRSV